VYGNGNDAFDVPYDPVAESTGAPGTDTDMLEKILEELDNEEYIKAKDEYDAQRALDSL